MQAAKQIPDAVLSVGFRKMAEFWLELGNKKLPHIAEGSSSRRQPSQCRTKSGRAAGRSRDTGAMKRNSKSPSKVAAKRRVGSH